nr:MipA/OmpV family protein [uncultured Holophaga sp.]
MKRLCFALALPALAGDTPQGPPPQGGWDLSVGLLGASGPKVPGSDESGLKVLPFFKADYKRRLFLGSNPAVLGLGVGVRAMEYGPFTWDLGLGYAQGRKENQADVLAGMGKQRDNLWGGTALSCHLGPVEFSLSGGHGLHAESGDRFKLGSGLHLRLGPRWMTGLQASISAANRKGMAYQFGVNGTQAAARQSLIASGDTRLRAGEDRLYQPAGGLSQADLGLMAGYRLTDHWNLMSMTTATHLMPKAAESPLVRRQNSISAGLGIHYHF